MQTIAATYLKSVIQICELEGCSRKELVKLVPGGEPALSDLLLRFSTNVFFDVLYRAEDLLGETGIGIKIGQSFRPKTFLQFGYALVSCANLREALDFNRKYQAVNQQLGRSKLVLENGSAFVEWESQHEAEYARPAVETVLTGYVGIGRWITWAHGGDVRSMSFRHKKPSHAALAESVYGCPISYNQPVDRLEFSESIVDRPMPASNPPLVKQLSKRLDKVLLAMHHPESVRLAVYRMIEQLLTEELPTAAKVAQRLGMSERTLRRRLAEEDQSFRSLLAQVRRDVSEIFLREPHKSLTDISQALGYSEHSAFVRAFRGWFGMTPSQYKRTISV